MDEYFPVADPHQPRPEAPPGAPASVRSSRRLLPFAIVAGALAMAAGGYLAGHATAGTGASGPKVAAATAVSAKDLTAANPAATTAASAPCQINQRGLTGTLKSVSGTSLTVNDANGKPIAVTTSPSTKITKTAAGAVSDVTNGSVVALHGTPTGQNAITAQQISILPASASQKLGPAGAAGAGPAGGRLAQRTPAAGFAVGTVSKAGNGTFTVTEPGGTIVAVTTTSSTKVVKTVDAAVKDLDLGQPIAVRGSANPDGSVAADQIVQGNTNLGPGTGFRGGFGPGGFGPGGFGPGGFRRGAGAPPSAAAPGTVH